MKTHMSNDMTGLFCGVVSSLKKEEERRRYERQG